MLPALHGVIRFYPVSFRPKTWEEGLYGVIVVIVLVLSGAGCLLLGRQPVRTGSGRSGLMMILLIGLAGRMLYWNGMPPIEDDFYRYQWDGAVSAAGMNPYAHSPQELLGALDEGSSAIAPELLHLARANRWVLEQINHPHLRTIYPPLAQGYFALAHWLGPFEMNGLRLAALLMDGLLLMLLLMYLRRSGMDSSAVAIYWCNPLIWYELYYRLHYDILILPLLAAFAWAVHRRKLWAGALWLSLAAAGRLWPVLLAPLLLLREGCPRRQRFLAGGMLVGLTAVTMLPYVPAVLDRQDSGLVQYMQQWEAHGFVFSWFSRLGWEFKDRFWHAGDGRLLARVVTTTMLLAICVRLSGRPAENFSRTAYRVGLVVMLMLLLSPTVYPWYYAVVLPLAVFAPRGSLLIWTALLPLSYLVWILKEQWSWYPQTVMGAILHVPVWWLIWREFKQDRAAQRERQGADVVPE